MPRTHTYTPRTRHGLQLLGLEIARARRERRLTIIELAERAGVSRVTVSAVESGSPTVAIGTVFELATILGLDLFGAEAQVVDALARSRDRLALLPSRVREPLAPVDDNF